MPATDHAVTIGSAADRSLPKWVLLWGLLCLFISAICVARHPVNTFFQITEFVSLTFVCYSLFRLFACAQKFPQTSKVSLADAKLPVISVLLPVYHEAHMIDRLVHHVSAIDYPRDKLDIFIICEPDDHATIKAAKCHASSHIRVFITDGVGPKTKPNALNAVLPSCEGEIITVYDAEDRPDPLQLRAAAHALGNTPSLAVVQAPLVYYNAQQNWLTRQFALEYNALFHVWIPFLSSLNLPFPLGGTSNHIRRSALISVGGWDEFNVTEDADLSFRFAASGWQLGYITHPTYEEAVSNWHQWNRQRSRWMKGYMQTWITHMKVPLLSNKKTGWKRLSTLQLTLGVTLINGFLHLPGVILITGILSLGLLSDSSFMPTFFLLTGLAISYAAGIIIGIIGAMRTGQTGLIRSSLVMPLYWLALFHPTVMALIDLCRRPFHWNKTAHGDSGLPNINDVQTTDRTNAHRT